MNLKFLFTLSAVVLFLLGSGLLLLPNELITMRTGQAPGALTIHMARQFAILSLVLGIISWRVRTSARSKELNAIIFGLIIAFIILPIETALSIRNGSESAEGWLLVILFSVLAIGFILAGRNNNSSKTKT